MKIKILTPLFEENVIMVPRKSGKTLIPANPLKEMYVEIKDIEKYRTIKGVRK